MPASRKNWDVTAIQQARQSYCKSINLWDIPKGWGTGACHHKISKEHLELLGRALERCISQGGLARKEQDADRMAAAREFWKIVQAGIDQEIMTQLASAPMTKVLWNLPVNLEVGPAAVAENPGQGFDPNTEAIPGGNGARRLTAESGSLQELERVCVPTLLRNHDYLPTAEEWTRMGQALTAASEAFDGYYAESKSRGFLARPRTEQWVTGDSGFQRKRLRRFLGAEAGRAKFAQNRAAGNLQQAANADVAALGLAWPQGGNYNVTDSDGTVHAIAMSLAASQMAHMCLRHTYQYFERTPDAIKLVNNFWPADRVSTVTGYRQLVTAAFPDIARAMLDCMEAAEVLEEYEGSITAVNVASGQDTLFFIAGFETDDPASRSWTVTLETVAPDGPSAETYPAQMLSQII